MIKWIIKVVCERVKGLEGLESVGIKRIPEFLWFLCFLLFEFISHGIFVLSKCGFLFFGLLCLCVCFGLCDECLVGFHFRFHFFFHINDLLIRFHCECRFVDLLRDLSTFVFLDELFLHDIRDDFCEFLRHLHSLFAGFADRESDLWSVLEPHLSAHHAGEFLRERVQSFVHEFVTRFLAGIHALVELSERLGFFCFALSLEHILIMRQVYLILCTTSEMRRELKLRKETPEHVNHGHRRIAAHSIDAYLMEVRHARDIILLTSQFLTDKLSYSLHTPIRFKTPHSSMTY